jgi:hypothetical protein
MQDYDGFRCGRDPIDNGRAEDKAQRDVVDVGHREVRWCSPAPERLTGSRDELYKTDFYEKTIDDERMFLDMDKTWVRLARAGQADGLCGRRWICLDKQNTVIAGPVSVDESKVPK